MIGIMEKGKKIPPQEASQTNPVAKPEDTKGGINNMVSSGLKGAKQASGLIGKKLAEQAEENEEMPMHHLIADKDYPSGIREWMITSPSELKYPTLVVAAAMLSVYLTRVRIQYVYDNQGEKSAIVLQVIVEGEQSSGKSFARYIMRTLMKPFIERDSEMRAKEQEYAALKRRQGKKDGKLPPEPKTDITILPETVSLTMFIKRCDAAVKLYGAPKTLFEFADEISAIVHSAKRQFADLSQVIKTAYDLGSVYGQDFMSETSYSAMVDALLSFVFCGTQSAVSRYMNKAAIEGGSVTRTILCPLISHLGDNPPQFQALTDTQRKELENTLDKLFGLCYEEDGKFHQEIEEDMSWLNKTVVKWCNDCRQQVVKTMSKSMDVFYKRSSVSAFRIAALMQVLYKVEGKKSEKEIRKLVRQTYLACADHILRNMLQRWGKAFEQISAEGEGEPYHTVDYFSELPQEFSYQFLEEFLTQKGLKTPARNMVCNWRRWGWLEKPKKGENKKVLRKTQQKTTHAADVDIPDK